MSKKQRVIGGAPGAATTHPTKSDGPRRHRGPYKKRSGDAVEEVKVRHTQMTAMCALLDDFVSRRIGAGLGDEDATEPLDPITAATAKSALEDGRATLYLELAVTRIGMTVTASVRGPGCKIAIAEIHHERDMRTSTKPFTTAHLEKVTKTWDDPITSALFPNLPAFPITDL